MKRAFSVIYLSFAFITLIWCLYRGAVSPDPLLIPLIVMVVAPLVQRLIPFDDWQVVHHKVRLPRVSLLVLLSMAALLLFADTASRVLWLGLVNLGGFLLDTYWASYDRR